MWTQFMDMHSGGSQKEDVGYIYIEASEEVAKVVFFNRFGHNPERVTCTCCGDDYSIGEYETLEQATAYERGCEYDGDLKKYVEKPSRRSFSNPYQTVDQYIKNANALFIYVGDIKPEEMIGSVPQQGFVWID